MPSYSRWNGVKCSGSKFLLTDVLKNELGFEGFLISDYNAIDQVDPDYKQAVEISINAGMDMAMAPNTYKQFYESLLELVHEGRVPQSRIDDAVTRILRVKAAIGLLDKNRSQLADRSLHKSFGSAEHRAVARDAVRKSLVLLKNENDVLPLAKSASRIHVAGKSADDIGNQCGGWTIEWQGKSGDITTGGTTILEAIEDTVADGTKVTYAKDGSGAKGADVGVLVIGEPPYAEGNGDTGELALAAEDVAAFESMKAAGIPVVVVLVSGRPLILEPILADADAVVAAWLPGTEGQGVADVLFGDFAPTGKLSFTWPRSVAAADQRRRRQVRPAVPVRLRPDLRRRAGRRHDRRQLTFQPRWSVLEEHGVQHQRGDHHDDAPELRAARAGEYEGLVLRQCDWFLEWHHDRH